MMATQNVAVSIGGSRYDPISELGFPINIDIDEGYCEPAQGVHITMEDLSRHFDQQSLHQRSQSCAIDTSRSHAYRRTTPTIHKRTTLQNHFSAVRRQRILVSRDQCSSVHLQRVSSLAERILQESDSSYQPDDNSSLNMSHEPCSPSDTVTWLPDTCAPIFADDWFCPPPSPFLSSPEDSESERSMFLRSDRQPVLFTRNMFDPPKSRRRNAVEKTARMRKRGGERAQRHRTT